MLTTDELGSLVIRISGKAGAEKRAVPWLCPLFFLRRAPRPERAALAFSIRAFCCLSAVHPIGRKGGSHFLNLRIGPTKIDSDFQADAVEVGYSPPLQSILPHVSHHSRRPSHLHPDPHRLGDRSQRPDDVECRRRAQRIRLQDRRAASALPHHRRSGFPRCLAFPALDRLFLRCRYHLDGRAYRRHAAFRPRRTDRRSRRGVFSFRQQRLHRAAARSADHRRRRARGVVDPACRASACHDGRRHSADGACGAQDRRQKRSQHALRASPDRHQSHTESAGDRACGRHGHAPFRPHHDGDAGDGRQSDRRHCRSGGADLARHGAGAIRRLRQFRHCQRHLELKAAAAARLRLGSEPSPRPQPRMDGSDRADLVGADRRQRLADRQPVRRRSQPRRLDDHGDNGARRPHGLALGLFPGRLSGSRHDKKSPACGPGFHECDHPAVHCVAVFGSGSGTGESASVCR
ncbi:probable sugar ABC transporter, permease protein [Rhizobium etli CFN 42]|uniref:Probable sugar ABC transporter, permease protein n=1 Tax=Rhizobium etli (strain ATCC 51251 / DSM 11541 / JCM 21823 / NBRC 15573 / CFN 42) TaxID=347834 RepID=Q2KDX7_RHIEC|nr:probable sugar ABC transporter, permease protein [Rhizobium etli CFN 42]